MTKREFRKRFSAEHQARASHPAHHHDIDSAVAAAEAAGVTWDPEPVIPPERIQAYRAIDCGPELNWHLGKGNTLGPDGWRNTEEQGAVYAEAVRRYNAWQLVERAAVLIERFGPTGTDLLEVKRLLADARMAK